MENQLFSALEDRDLMILELREANLFINKSLVNWCVLFLINESDVFVYIQHLRSSPGFGSVLQGSRPYKAWGGVCSRLSGLAVYSEGAEYRHEQNRDKQENWAGM